MNDFILSHQVGFFLFGSLGFILSLCAFGGMWYVLARYKRLRRELDVFFGGSDPRSFEDTILAQTTRLTFLDKEIEELYNISNRIHDIAQRGICKTALVRFNPFGDKGYSQSFSLALLDGKYDGYVISSLHTREGTRIYAKSVSMGDTRDDSFTQEEREAVALACSKAG